MSLISVRILGSKQLFSEYFPSLSHIFHLSQAQILIYLLTEPNLPEVFVSTQLISAQNKPVDRGYLANITATHSETYEITEFSTIGRDEANQIKVNDGFSSKRHARIRLKEGKFFIEDLNSSNGTFVNGTKILVAELKDRDRITIGKKNFLFTLRSQSKSDTLKLTSKNPSWNERLQRVSSMAATEFPVLITGPSGSGKEILAQLIHEHSLRNTGPFVSVNCSALSENLVESELFGHMKGSFTGAENDRKGAFESARNGTLFLDEIGDLPLSLQPKLLRALENGEIKPVGSDKSIRTHVRIVAATHNTLIDKVRRGQFREDLFYRLNVLKLNPPALIDRMEDFEDLLYFFCKEYRVSFSFAAIQKLKTHSWPGNIRELKNFVARASALFQQKKVEDVELDILLDNSYVTIEPSPINELSNTFNLKAIEREIICRALKKNRGNQRKSAEQLGLPKSTLNDRIKTYNINLENLLDNS